MLALLAALTSAPALASTPVPASAPSTADAAPAETPHRVGLGVRGGVWYGGAGAPMVGGQVSLRPSRSLRLLGFADHAMKGGAGVLQVDHVIGFHALLPVLRRGDTWAGVALGSCVDFRTWRDADRLGLLRADVLFGPRAGLHLEHDLDGGFSLQATATSAVYAGNTADTYGWGETTRGLRATAVVQGQVGVTRWW